MLRITWALSTTSLVPRPIEDHILQLPSARAYLHANPSGSYATTTKSEVASRNLAACYALPMPGTSQTTRPNGQQHHKQQPPTTTTTTPTAITTTATAKVPRRLAKAASHCSVAAGPRFFQTHATKLNNLCYSSQILSRPKPELFLAQACLKKYCNGVNEIHQLRPRCLAAKVRRQSGLWISQALPHNKLPHFEPSTVFEKKNTG